MANCKYCGGEIDAESKFCEYCGKVVNEKGKDYSEGGKAFEIKDIVKIFNRAMVVGKPMQNIKNGDVLYLNEKSFTVLNMQLGQRVVDNVGPECAQVGIVFENFNVQGLKRGDVLTFKKA